MRLGLLLSVSIAALGCERSVDPQGNPPSAIDCATVAAKIRATYTDEQVKMFRSEPKMSRWFDTTIRIVEQSCNEDRWPDAVRRCAVEAKPHDSVALTTCNQAMPVDLQSKMQERMVEAMKALD